jgi:hypothetical protein
MRNDIPQRASRTTSQNYPVEEEDDDGYTTSIPRSAIRYPLGRPYTFQQGNRRIVLHPEHPPRKIHWLFYVGVGMVIAASVWVASTYLTNWWTLHQEDATYGNPRTYQVDQVVGHDDSTSHPTHFIFLNLNGRVVIIELPSGNVSHARIYNGPAIIGENPAQTPVTAEFQDVDGDGKIDMIVHIGNQQFTYLNDGTQFKPQQ